MSTNKSSILWSVAAERPLRHDARTTRKGCSYASGVILASSLNSYYSSRYAMMELLPIHSILPSSKGLMLGSQNVLGQQNSVYKQSLFPGGLFIDASP
jgi:hypothetical protein